MNLYLPSPPISGFQIGPIFIYIYALCILTGMLVAAWLGRKRFVARGGNPDHFEMVVLVAIIFGIIGARAYHVITDWQLYFGPGKNPWQALNIRSGGLGVMGGVTFGALGAWIMTRRYRLNFASFADVLAPALLFAQAIGRFGNWFNQELFGLPTTVPWALEIDPIHRPDGYEQYDTFHPTFLYESLWNVGGGFLLIWAEKRFALGRGRLFTCYIIWYTLGRSVVEQLRIDPANEIGGIRIHNLVSIILLIAALLFAIWQAKYRPGVLKDPFGNAVTEVPVAAGKAVTQGDEKTNETSAELAGSPAAKSDSDAPIRDEDDQNFGGPAAHEPHEHSAKDQSEHRPADS